jgi:hypothetical protein
MEIFATVMEKALAERDFGASLILDPIKAIEGAKLQLTQDEIKALSSACSDAYRYLLKNLCVLSVKPKILSVTTICCPD